MDNVSDTDGNTIPNDIVIAGIEFLQCISDHYGAEKTIEIWEKFGEAIGRDVQHEVFLKMLSGDMYAIGDVQIQRGQCSDIHAIKVIKAIREGTGYSLKEAKDAWDVSSYRTVDLRCTNKDTKTHMISELLAHGIKVL